MSQHVTESIWHFIGYMHLEELLNRIPVHYSGANAYSLQTINHSKTGPVRDQAISLFPSGRETPTLKVELPATPPLIFAARPLPLQPLAIEPALTPPEVNPALDLATVLPGLTNGGAGGVSAWVAGSGGSPARVDGLDGGSAPPTVKVSATYRVGEDQFSDLRIAQANSLVDADIMRGDPSVLVAAGLGSAMLSDAAEVSPELAQLVHKAIDALPSNATPASSVDGIEHVNVTQDAALRVEIPTESDVAAEEVEAGHYVDGGRIGNGGTSAEVIDEQIAKVGEAVDGATPVEHGVVETKTAPDGELEIVTGPTPTGGVAHEAITGENDLVNAAVLYDLSDAAGSIIVRGDVNQTDAIVQINVLQDNDAHRFSSTAFLEAAIAQNGVTNEATFVQETGPVYGNVLLGGVPGSLSWQIDYVQGSVYDLTAVEQRNVFIDTDISEQTTTSTHFTATLGENGAVNLAQLNEFATSYDLIIVGGHYHEFNSIVQVNVLLDDDVVHQLAHAPAADQSVNAEGNSLSNDAAIVRIGGDSYKPLAGDPASLAEAIGNMEAEFDYTFATGLPGNGADTLRVLYIADDYYDYNVLLQTNVLSDVDHVEQVAAADGPERDGQGGEGSGTLAQVADADGNSLQNLALLVKVDSTSDYQYVGGAVYEDTLLVQANIVTESSEAIEADLHPDVVATIAALSGSPEDATPDNDSLPDHSDTSDSVDVIGSILT